VEKAEQHSSEFCTHRAGVVKPQFKVGEQSSGIVQGSTTSSSWRDRSSIREDGTESTAPVMVLIRHRTIIRTRAFLSNPCHHGYAHGNTAAHAKPNLTS
jgi:hypothetical protein